MLFEHWIYSTAIAIIVGMLYYKLTGREYSWIIIASAYAPDVDMIADAVLKKIGITVIANEEVLIIGIIAVVLCVILRTAYEGTGWIKKSISFAKT